MNTDQPYQPRMSPLAQMGVFWRILHLMTARYGNGPMGQTLVALTMVFLNEQGLPPTLTDLCEATGLPKASVSRYVSWQLREGLCKEHIDPADRRRRLLVQTEKGKAEWDWQIQELGEVFADAARVYRESLNKGALSGEVLLEMMKALTKKSPQRHTES